MDIGAPLAWDALPARCRLRPCPEHPWWVGVPGRGQRHPPKKPPPGHPEHSAPIASPRLEPSIPSTDGQNSWATVPKSPQHPHPNCGVPPALSRAPQHLPWVGTSGVPTPPRSPSHSSGHWGFTNPAVSTSLERMRGPREPGSPHSVAFQLQADTKKKRERRKMDARSTPAPPPCSGTQKPL